MMNKQHQFQSCGENAIKSHVLKQIMQRYISFDELTKEALRYTMDEHKIQYDREDINRLFDAF